MELVHTPDNRRRFEKLTDEMLRTIWQSNPVVATVLGVHDYDHTLGDVSAESVLSHGRAFKRYIELLDEEIDPSLLDSEQRLDYHVAHAIASSNYVTLSRHRPWTTDPGCYLSLAVLGSFILLLREFAPFEHRVECVLHRMRRIPDMLSLSQANLTDCPAVLVETAVEIAHGAEAFFAEAMPEAASKVPGLKAELMAASEAAILAFAEYRKWLRDSLLPEARPDFAVGRGLYKELLAAEHQLAWEPEDIIEMGRKALADTLLEIEEVAESIDPSVSWHELVLRLKLEHPTRDALMPAYQEAIESARAFVTERNIVSVPDGEHLGLREMPAFQRVIMPYAGYLAPGPFEPSLTGHFWVSCVDGAASEEHQEAQLLGHCRYNIPIIAIHEGYPGHHLQLIRASGLRSDVRKAAMSNLLMEGWALYCEEMMYEQGFYENPRIRLFQLKDLLWRACRVIIDVGLHTGGLTFDEAVRMLVDTAHLEGINAAAEVKRYAMSPTQPMTYVVGKMLILNLREKVKRALGGHFSLKEFHDELLSYGSIPPTLIAENVIARLSSTAKAA